MPALVAHRRRCRRGRNSGDEEEPTLEETEDAAEPQVNRVLEYANEPLISMSRSNLRTDSFAGSVKQKSDSSIRARVGWLVTPRRPVAHPERAQLNRGASPLIFVTAAALQVRSLPDRREGVACDHHDGLAV
jgi:hypothetical protein